jgi:hypothetical protein
VVEKKLREPFNRASESKESKHNAKGGANDDLVRDRQKYLNL